MRKYMLLTTLAAAAVIAAGITVQAQSYGPNMMGNGQDYAGRGDCGPGQTFGQGDRQGDSQGDVQRQNQRYGRGMMQGNGPGPGMMQGNGNGPGPGMMQGNGPGPGPGMMRGNGNGPGPGMMQGNAYGPGDNRGSQSLNLSIDDVKTRVERWLAQQGNQRLKLGDVKEKDVDTIIADVVTKDNSLVERFIIDRRTGTVRQDNG